MNYLQDFSTAKVIANGLHIKRELAVQKDGQWLDIFNDSLLKVGDIVRVKITVNSPIEREHIAVKDSIAGGFEAINPDLNNQYYNNDMNYRWFELNRIEIRNGIAFACSRVVQTVERVQGHNLNRSG